ncbi:hypothetical protein KIN20_025032 [Parelaphostrongylus tenuis]|uniref:Uncharacterized protein n=1 Tax=Parelaphostrongylus tenuis TaxID=148309 RepID=A0AAD5MUG8_PARTN|nr:hypothetical protein KIN20_025032 [Parelaphostrongylus tenuis]
MLSGDYPLTRCATFLTKCDAATAVVEEIWCRALWDDTSTKELASEVESLLSSSCGDLVIIPPRAANSLLIRPRCLAERDAELAGADGAILPPMKSRSKSMHHQ